MKRSIGVIIAALWIGGAGCATEPELGTDAPRLEVVSEGAIASGVPDTVIFESRMASKFGLPNMLDPNNWDSPVLDPCSCVTPTCLDSWASSQLGCSVCVSLYCDGAPGPHVCSDACAP